MMKRAMFPLLLVAPLVSACGENYGECTATTCCDDPAFGCFQRPGSEPFAHSLRQRLGGEAGLLEHRQFPDGETYLRIMTDVTGRNIVLVCGLDHPDVKLLPLLFAAKAWYANA